MIRLNYLTSEETFIGDLGSIHSHSPSDFSVLRLEPHHRQFGSISFIPTKVVTFSVGLYDVRVDHSFLPKDILFPFSLKTTGLLGLWILFEELGVLIHDHYRRVLHVEGALNWFIIPFYPVDMIAHFGLKGIQVSGEVDVPKVPRRDWVVHLWQVVVSLKVLVRAHVQLLLNSTKVAFL